MPPQAAWQAAAAWQEALLLAAALYRISIGSVRGGTQFNSTHSQPGSHPAAPIQEPIHQTNSPIHLFSTRKRERAGRIRPSIIDSSSISWQHLPNCQQMAAAVMSRPAQQRPRNPQPDVPLTRGRRASNPTKRNETSQCS